MSLLPRLRVVVALGKIAWDAWLTLLSRRLTLPRPRPAFGHGATFSPRDCTPATPTAPGCTPGTSSTLGTLGTLGTPGTPCTSCTLFGCFHPSRQNTNTGRVTAAMYDDLFGKGLRTALGEDEQALGSRL